MRTRSHSNLLRRLPVLALLAFAGLLVPQHAQAACSDPNGACVEGATLEHGARLSKSARTKQAKKNAKKKDVNLKVEIENGRGSAFVDGRYLAPGTVRAIKPGKHDLEVRNGERVLARGVLDVSKGTTEVAVTVVGGG